MPALTLLAADGSIRFGFGAAVVELPDGHAVEIRTSGIARAWRPGKLWPTGYDIEALPLGDLDERMAAEQNPDEPLYVTATDSRMLSADTVRSLLAVVERAQRDVIVRIGAEAGADATAAAAAEADTAGT